MKKREKNRRVFVIIIFLILSLAVYRTVIRPQQLYYAAHHVDIHGTYLFKPIALQNFSLTDTHHHSFTKSNLLGHWTMLFFGFAHCQAVCPTTLSALAKMTVQLQQQIPASELPQIVFVTVDPLHDSNEKLAAYVTSFNPHFIGVTSSTENIIGLAKELHLEIQNDKNSSLDHSPEIVLINPAASIQAYFSYPHQGQELAKDYIAILKQSLK